MTPGKRISTDRLPDHVARWIDGVQRRLRVDIDDLAPEGLRQVRPGHRKLLQMIDADGSTITDLATSARMTKQALGEAVDLMEGDGLVVSGRDDADRRVRLVRRTEQGDVAVAQVDVLFVDVEERWREQLGDRRFATMKQAMRELAADQF